MRFTNDRLVGFLLWLLAGACMAAPGDIDLAFGHGGSLPAAGTILPMPDGRLVMGQQFRSSVAGNSFVVQTYDAQGHELNSVTNLSDATFGGPAARGADGKLLFTGERTRSDGSLIRAVLRLTTDGRPDASFGTRADGTVDLPDRKAIVGLAGLQDGRTLVLQWDAVCGSDGIGVSCSGSLLIRRLLANGNIDMSFGVNGVAEVPDSDITGDWVALFGVRPDGSILVGDNSSVPTLAVLTPDGAIDTTFNATTARGSADWWHRGTLLPDGGMLLAGVTGVGNRVEDWDTRLLKIRPDGRVDTGFGNGTGMVTLNLSSIVSNRTDIVEGWPDIATSSDGSRVYLRTTISGGSSFDFSCPAVVRLSASGVLDTAFGQRGVTCVTRSDDRLLFLDRLLIQASGEPLLVMGHSNGAILPPTLLRLRTDNAPSPGIINIRSGAGGEENVGTIAIKVARTAGRNGAVSVNYATEPGTALTGDDFTTASGRLDWADGDDTERTITLSIRNDTVREQDIESFTVRLSSPTGGPLLLVSTGTVNIYDDDAAATQTPAPTPAPSPTPVSNSPGGGGGAIRTPALILLTGLLVLALRRRLPQYGAA